MRRLRDELPKTKILLLGIFPRGKVPGELRANVAKSNKLILRIADGRTIYYLDIGGKFVEPDGSISKEIMPDYLHLSPKGYRIRAEAIESKLAELMSEKNSGRLQHRY